MNRENKGGRYAMAAGVMLFTAGVAFLSAFFSCVFLKTNRVVEDGTKLIEYEGEQYTYNPDLVNILCLGIDSHEELNRDGLPGERGQSDAIYLVSLDTHTKEVRILNIPRDTMVPVSIYDVSGEFVSMQTMQITLQHAFGDDEEDSCRKTAKAVSSLLGDIPIHRYCAVNFGAVPALNDAVGGVEVQMDSEYVDAWLAKCDPAFTPGNIVRLTGMQSYYYLSVRDITVYASCEERVERQKIYISRYVDAVKEKMRADGRLLFELYSALQKNMTTQIGIVDLWTLSQYISEINFDSPLLSIPGRRVEGEVFEEFYPDEDELQKMIAELFYVRSNGDEG